MTESRARRNALKLARQNKRVYYVVWSIEDRDMSGQHYHTADDKDLDTYFAGISDSHIIFCTAD